MIVRNLNKTIEIGLNKTFNERFDCFQRTFDTNLVRLNKLYFEQLSNRTNASQTDLPKKKKNKEKNQSSDSSFAQIGFIFYSINSNPKTNVEQFKHESILFLNPSNVLNLNITQLEHEIFALSNDVSILKSLLSQAKETLKEKVHLLKESKETKKTEKTEKKFKTDKKNKENK